MLSEEKWYSSAEHFRTEMSYSEYVKKMEKKKKKKKSSTSFLGTNLKMPNFRL